MPCIDKIEDKHAILNEDSFERRRHCIKLWMGYRQRDGKIYWEQILQEYI